MDGTATKSILYSIFGVSVPSVGDAEMSLDCRVARGHFGAGLNASRAGAQSTCTGGFTQLACPARRKCLLIDHPMCLEADCAFLKSESKRAASSECRMKHRRPTPR